MISARYQRTLACVGLFLSSHVASQQPVKVDDANMYSSTNHNGIQFSPTGWNTISQETTPVHYNGTYAWTQEAGANLIYFFRGTGIACYADGFADFGPIIVLVDGQAYGGSILTKPGDFQHQQKLWNVTELPEGDHQIVVTKFGTGNTPNDTLGLDYLEVIPGVDGMITAASYGPGASSIPSDAIIVDDSSDMISYSDSWWEVENYGLMGQFFLGGSQHSSTALGASATFTFNGTAVWFFSSQEEKGTIVDIKVDDGEPDSIDTASTSGRSLMQVLTWGKTGLSDGPHTVTITNMGWSDGHINLDFFMYMPSTGSSSSPKKGSASAPIGAIVGGVVGGVALIALILGVLIWQWRRRPTQDETASEHETYAGTVDFDEKESYAPADLPVTRGLHETPDFAPKVAH